MFVPMWVYVWQELIVLLIHKFCPGFLPYITVISRVFYPTLQWYHVHVNTFEIIGKVTVCLPADNKTGGGVGGGCLKMFTSS